MPMPGITAPEAQHFRSGLGQERDRTSLPVLVPTRSAAAAAAPGPLAEEWLSPPQWQQQQQQSRARLDSDRDVMVSSTSSEKRPTRKERARRHLVGHIGKKVIASPAVTRSYSTNAADRKKSPERVRPSKRHDPGSPGRRRDVGETSLPHFRRQPAHAATAEPETEDSDEEVVLVAGHGHPHKNSQQGRLRWTSSTTKHSGATRSSTLPELMQQLNSGLRRLEQSRLYQDRLHRQEDASSLDSDMECDVNDMLDNLAVHWDRNRRAKRMRENPCVTRHRPLTPGLIERLDKLKLSSRTKTERWVSQLPAHKRASQEDYCKLGQVNTASVQRGHAVDPVSHEWLYDNPLSSHGP